MKRFWIIVFFVYWFFTFSLSLLPNKNKIHTYVKPLRAKIIPNDYKMFVGFKNRKSILMYTFYNLNEEVSIDVIKLCQSQINSNYPFISNYYKPFSSFYKQASYLMDDYFKIRYSLMKTKEYGNLDSNQLNKEITKRLNKKNIAIISYLKDLKMELVKNASIDTIKYPFYKFEFINYELEKSDLLNEQIKRMRYIEPKVIFLSYDSKTK
ncbi:MAG: hypothetical protein H6604_06815 [Flavobacteriales bacterium]|nr:hypothetical protein [Flavobacteriales bacterium]